MKIPKPKTEAPKPKAGAVALTIRISPEFHEKLAAAAAEQAWTINAEINHRLRAVPVLDQLRALTAEVAYLKSVIERQKPD